MPRDGSGVYSKPAGIDASPNTTIESADWNAFTADVEQDLNTARPVVAGGTGSATAVGGSDNLSKAGADMASASTLNLANATGTQINVTGTTTITALGTVAAGAERELIFAGSLTLTHNATTLILPGAANIQTAAGDVARMRSIGGGNWRCMSYQRASGQPIGGLSQQPITLKQSAAPTPTAEGDIQWDTDDNVLVIGDGAGQQIFVPLPASVAAGDVFYATDAKALARLAKGTAGQVLQMNTGATAPQWTTLPFTKTFESTQQTITSAGALTLAHGLTVQPKLIQVCIICQTADAGYSAGDELEMNIGVAPNSGPRGISVVPDSTNLNIRFASGGSVFDVLNKSTGSTTGITLTNWKLIVRAWA